MNKKKKPFEMVDYGEGGTQKPVTPVVPEVEKPTGNTVKDDVLSIFDATVSDPVSDYMNYTPPEWGGQKAWYETMDFLNNRPDFSFDVEGDALYKMYADKYINQGNMAMRDAMGQASALTGGYGNSYAATVGNQAYQASMQELTSVIPELYEVAYNRYQQDTENAYDKLSALNADYAMHTQDWQNEYQMLADKAALANKGSDPVFTPIDLNDVVSRFDIETVERLEGAKTNVEVGEILASLEAAGVISEEEANAYMAAHEDPYETYDDDGNPVVNYSSLVNQPNAWSVASDGGANLWGIDRNAKVVDPYGNELTLKELRKKLMEEDMNRDEAKEAIKKLQRALGITDR